MDGALILIVATVAVAALFRWATRPHTAIKVDDGQVQLQRGSPPNALVHDLADVARSAPDATGRILLSGAGQSVQVEVRGLGDDIGQRVRNVVQVHHRRIR